MRYLLDTCVISELIKQKPNAKFIAWVRSQREEDLFVSTLTIGEFQKGISKLPASRKKSGLQSWLDDALVERFEGRILGIDAKVAKKWGEIQASTEAHGRKLPVIDSLIASTAIAHEMAVVTRNVDDMESTGAILYNPWERR